MSHNDTQMNPYDELIAELTYALDTTASKNLDDLNITGLHEIHKRVSKLNDYIAMNIYNTIISTDGPFDMYKRMFVELRNQLMAVSLESIYNNYDVISEWLELYCQAL